MIDQRDYEIAEKLINRLSEIVQLVDFRVFGSRARGGGFIKCPKLKRRWKD